MTPFGPRAPVQWFSPPVLARAAMHVALSHAFGAFLDKRELQGTLSDRYLDLSDLPAVGIDYIADTGDGFDATATVAWLAAQPELRIGDLPALPRADLLVLGGDQVYPTASADEYEARLAGPYSAALPERDGPVAALGAVPGNHDWYDGLTSFMRLFAQGNTIGGWGTFQARSYFAVRLPHRWWLWAIDTQFGAYLDEPQLDYFRSVELQKGDRVIVCAAEPSWLDSAADPRTYRNLAYLERKLIRPEGATVALMLAGDHHLYARHTSDETGTHKVVAGGGGAFLHPTHNLPSAINVAWDPGEPVTGEGYELRATYPSAARSQALSTTVPALLPARNPSFMTLTAVLYGVFAAALLDTGGSTQPTTALSVGPTIALLVIGAVLVGFAKPPRTASGWGMRVSLGVAHTAAHAATAYGLLKLAGAALPAAGIPMGRMTAVTFAALAGGPVGSFIFGLYLAAANLTVGAHPNEAFSAIRIDGYKHLIRMRIGTDGTLTAHTIGMDRTVRGWNLPTPDAGLQPSGEYSEPRVRDTFTVPADAPDVSR